MRKVLRAAIARNLMAEGPASAFPSGWLAAHRGKGGVCPRCTAPLATIKIGGAPVTFAPVARLSGPLGSGR